LRCISERSRQRWRRLADRLRIAAVALAEILVEGVRRLQRPWTTTRAHTTLTAPDGRELLLI
jgi:hypothetical protein